MKTSILNRLVPSDASEEVMAFIAFVNAIAPLIHMASGYIYGGALRDICRGELPKDLDIKVTDPEVFAEGFEMIDGIRKIGRGVQTGSSGYGGYPSRKLTVEYNGRRYKLDISVVVSQFTEKCDFRCNALKWSPQKGVTTVAGVNHSLVDQDIRDGVAYYMGKKIAFNGNRPEDVTMAGRVAKMFGKAGWTIRGIKQEVVHKCVKFMSELSEGNCPICQEKLRQPLVTNCGHIYCKECIQSWRDSGRSAGRTCPTCRREVSPNDDVEIHLPGEEDEDEE